MPEAPPIDRARVLPSLTSPFGLLGAHENLDHRALTEYGATTLTEVLVDVGHWDLQQNHQLLSQFRERGHDGNARSTLPEGPARQGFFAVDTGALEVLVDGVPALPSSAYLRFPIFTLLPLTEIYDAQLLSGPRVQLTSSRASQGVLSLRTVPPPSEARGGVPMYGVVEGRLGGAGLEKSLNAHTGVGIGTFRVHLAAGIYDVENRSLGRDAAAIFATQASTGTPLPGTDVGKLDFSNGHGGHLGMRVDLQPLPHFHLFGTWQSARLADVPYAQACERNVSNRISDCSQIEELGRDAFIVGGDGELNLSGFKLRLHGRAHMQRFLQLEQHVGVAVGTIEQTQTDLLRGGAIGKLTLLPPQFHLAGAPLVIQVQVGLSTLRDRVEANYQSRSQRFADGAFREGFGISELERAPLVTGTLTGQDALLVEGYAKYAALHVEGKLRFTHHPYRVPMFVERVPDLYEGNAFSAAWPDASQEATGQANDANQNVFQVAGSLRASAQIFDFVEVHAVFVRLSDAPQTALLSGGWGVAERHQLRAAGAAARTLSQPVVDDPAALSSFASHSVEGGVRINALGFVITSTAFAESRTGRYALLLRDDVTRWQELPEQRVLGLRAALRWTLPVDGWELFARAQVEAVDEVLDDEQPLETTFASFGPAPKGRLRLRYSSSSERGGRSLFSAWTQLRAQAPHLRLSPTERADVRLCPEVALSELAPCRGVEAAIAWDAGVRFHPVDVLEVDALVDNLLDAPILWWDNALPEGGISARVVVRFRF
ncbi:MAG: hypothetical protein GY822_31150 [Deltaproteobacteria bacterium]|nr:hypothetical protein [Deltaproteobacteria bacterium]